MSLLGPIQARIQYKIIIPFLLLALLVALAGASVALLVITGSAQDRLRNQLAQVARDASDRVVLAERSNLALLREIAFALPQSETGAPAPAAALAASDPAGLEQALDPFFRVSVERGAQVDRLIAFDRSGQTLLDWERIDGDADQRRSYDRTDLSQLPFVRAVLSGQSDPIGDKYAGLLILSDKRYLYTVAPVSQNGQVVGGLIAAIDLRSYLGQLNRQIQAALVTIYSPADGTVFITSADVIERLDTLTIRPQVLPQVRELSGPRQQQGVIDIVRINQRDYQVAYAPLQVRSAIVGVISFALSNDYVTGPWSDLRLPLILLTGALLLAIMLLGIIVARQITRPLQHLVDTAQAVIAGDLARRSPVATQDEVGVLASHFNAMTGHLLTMYSAVQNESSQRAAIVESIADGIVVLALDRSILLINPAMRDLLRLSDGDPPPARFSDIPLRPLSEAALTYGSTRTLDLYQLDDRIVRVSAAPIHRDDGVATGYVCVFQDLSAEVAVDRAKTNFIATISHELRTPLTVIGGNSDLLLSGLMGSLSADQRDLVEGIRRYTSTTTALINNMITVAGLDAQSIPFELAPVDLAALLDDVLMSKRRAFRARGLSVTLDLPPDLPPALADSIQLRVVFHQLLDNAARYTDQGGVTISAAPEEGRLIVRVCDTGRGIEPALQGQLFTRFMRGSEGINSEERGIGLGLAIARELLERQGGRIWLAATSDHGTTFCIAIPQAHETISTPDIRVTQPA